MECLMNDFVFIPKNIAQLLFDEVLSWEEAESIVTLLTIPVLRSSVESAGFFSRYILNLRSVSNRVITSLSYSKFTFNCESVHVPFIADFEVTSGHNKKISYWVHRLCNPVNFSRRHCLDTELLEYPPKIWKIPRHTLIRWRYSNRLPVHKSNFAICEKTDFENFDEKTCPPPTLLFKRITDLFYSLTRQVDESSLSYSFFCYFYYFVHDRFLDALRNKRVSLSFRIFLARFLEILLVEANSSNWPQKRIHRIEGRLRYILPKDFFTKHPFSIFSYQNVVKEERLKL